MMSYMMKEIQEQPAVIQRLLTDELENIKAIGEEISRRDIRFIVIVARGTSDNAGTYGKYLFECKNGLPVSLAAPSVLTLYDAKLRLENALVVGISQSGGGADVNHFLSRAGELGAFTVGITNTPDSPLTSVAQRVILCRAGVEKAVAATKTYVAELGTLVLMSWAMGADGRLLDELRGCVDGLAQVAAMSKDVEAVASAHRDIEELVVLARGMNHATAMEVALKLQETSYIGAKGFSGADFLHGPLAMVEPGFPMLAFAPPGKGSDSMRDLFRRVESSGGHLTVVSSDATYGQGASHFLRVPMEVDEALSPIPYVVMGQLFACHLAVTKGNNPDRPRSLTKVTSTM